MSLEKYVNPNSRDKRLFESTLDTSSLQPFKLPEFGQRYLLLGAEKIIERVGFLGLQLTITTEQLLNNIYFEEKRDSDWNGWYDSRDNTIFINSAKVNVTQILQEQNPREILGVIAIILHEIIHKISRNIICDENSGLQNSSGFHRVLISDLGETVVFGSLLNECVTETESVNVANHVNGSAAREIGIGLNSPMYAKECYRGIVPAYRILLSLRAFEQKISVQEIQDRLFSIACGIEVVKNKRVLYTIFNKQDIDYFNLDTSDESMDKFGDYVETLLKEVPLTTLREMYAYNGLDQSKVDELYNLLHTEGQ